MPVDFHGHLLLFGIFGQLHDASLITELCGDFTKLGGVKGDGSGVEAGVAGEFLRGKNILVQHKTNLALLVIHKRKYAGASAFNAQNVFKMLLCGKAQAGRADLLGKILGQKGLVAGHAEEVKGASVAGGQH